MSLISTGLRRAKVRFPYHSIVCTVAKCELSSKGASCSDLKVNFDDKSFLTLKTNEELRRSILVFTLCKIKPLVKVSKFLMDMSYFVLRENITDFFMKKTFFGHFCAGETTKGVCIFV